MNINETYKKFPIKFYEKPDGTIYYETKFFNGTAKTLDQAFKDFSERDWNKDLLYYYDDVMDVQFGAFVPAYTDRKYKGMLYLGQIDLRLDINKDFGSGEHSVTYLSNNKEAQEKHNKYVSDLKRQEKISDFKDKIKKAVKKLAGAVSGKPVYEMFDPRKTRKDLICEHCGEIIPTATYYEEYQGNAYHLECIWDKFYNEKKSESYEDCQEYFMSLQKHLRHWKNDIDVKEDYLADLEFVKINKRKLGF